MLCCPSRQVVFAKSVFIIATNMFTFMPKPQSLLMLVMVLYIVWLNMHTLPFLTTPINYIW